MEQNAANLPRPLVLDAATLTEKRSDISRTVGIQMEEQSAANLPRPNTTMTSTDVATLTEKSPDLYGTIGVQVEEEFAASGVQFSTPNAYSVDGMSASSKSLVNMGSMDGEESTFHEIPGLPRPGIMASPSTEHHEALLSGHVINKRSRDEIDRDADLVGKAPSSASYHDDRVISKRSMDEPARVSYEYASYPRPDTSNESCHSVGNHTVSRRSMDKEDSVLHEQIPNASNRDVDRPLASNESYQSKGDYFSYESPKFPQLGTNNMNKPSVSKESYYTDENYTVAEESMAKEDHISGESHRYCTVSKEHISEEDHDSYEDTPFSGPTAISEMDDSKGRIPEEHQVPFEITTFQRPGASNVDKPPESIEIHQSKEDYISLESANFPRPDEHNEDRIVRKRSMNEEDSISYESTKFSRPGADNQTLHKESIHKENYASYEGAKFPRPSTGNVDMPSVSNESYDMAENRAVGKGRIDQEHSILEERSLLALPDRSKVGQVSASTAGGYTPSKVNIDEEHVPYESPKFEDDYIFHESAKFTRPETSTEGL